jgi:hypothetical protein
MTRFLAGLGLALGLVSGAAALAQDSAGRRPRRGGALHQPGLCRLSARRCMMQDLAARDDVIALSLHVDYWNYLGWEDTFSQAVFTDRQYGYGRAAGRRWSTRRN